MSRKRFQTRIQDFSKLGRSTNILKYRKGSQVLDGSLSKKKNILYPTAKRFELGEGEGGEVRGKG